MIKSGMEVTRDTQLVVINIYVVIDFANVDFISCNMNSKSAVN